LMLKVRISLEFFFGFMTWRWPTTGIGPKGLLVSRFTQPDVSSFKVRSPFKLLGNASSQRHIGLLIDCTAPSELQYSTQICVVSRLHVLVYTLKPWKLSCIRTQRSRRPTCAQLIRWSRSLSLHLLLVIILFVYAIEA